MLNLIAYKMYLIDYYINIIIKCYTNIFHSHYKLFKIKPFKIDTFFLRILSSNTS